MGGRGFVWVGDVVAGRAPVSWLCVHDEYMTMVENSICYAYDEGECGYVDGFCC